MRSNDILRRFYLTVIPAGMTAECADGLLSVAGLTELNGGFRLDVFSTPGGLSEAVLHEIDRLKTLDDRFHDRELARILSYTFGAPFDDRTVKKLWQQSAVSGQGHPGLWDYHAHPNRYQARLQVVQPYDRGWDEADPLH